MSSNINHPNYTGFLDWRREDQIRKPMRRFLLCGLLTISLWTGCGHGKGSPHPVDPQLARNTLEDVLSSWQQGETPQAWREKSPAVVIQDMAWTSGEKLTDFELQNEGTAVDANLVCDVLLKLENRQGQAHEQQVTYLVSTSPVITVFRQIIR